MMEYEKKKRKKKQAATSIARRLFIIIIIIVQMKYRRWKLYLKLKGHKFHEVNEMCRIIWFLHFECYTDWMLESYR